MTLVAADEKPQYLSLGKVASKSHGMRFRSRMRVGHNPIPQAASKAMEKGFPYQPWLSLPERPFIPVYILTSVIHPGANMKDSYRFSRAMYILEAALEYFIAISVSTVYLAKITAYMGISDALTGVLSAFVSLGCGFQLLAIFLANRGPVKGWVTSGHIISQLLFSLLYFVPLLQLTKPQRTILFVAILFAAQAIHNIINSPKINWFMSLVDDRSRGRFTANKEMVSLLGGMAFSYGLGAVMDRYEARGDLRGAFVVCGIGLLVLTMLHSLTLLLSVEKPTEEASKRETISRLLHNKTLIKIILVPVLWNVANYATVSFSGTYQANELAFTTTYSSVIIMVGSLIRAAISRPIGKFADTFSFRKMLIGCFAVEALAFGINGFTSPFNGRWLYFCHYILYSIGTAGINSAIINLIYDYVEHEQRMSALALQQTCAGLAGFLIVILLSPLVKLIQTKELYFFGARVYAQQLLSLFSCGLMVATIFYLHTAIKKLSAGIIVEEGVQ